MKQRHRVHATRALAAAASDAAASDAEEEIFIVPRQPASKPQEVRRRHAWRRGTGVKGTGGTVASKPSFISASLRFSCSRDT